MVLLLLLITFVTNDYLIKVQSQNVAKPLTLWHVEQELIKQNVKHINIVMKQIKLETGHLKYVKDFNLFGFTTKKGLMKFKSLEEAVTYKKQWQDKYYRGGNYYFFLRKIGYAQDSNYIRKLKQI